MKLHLVSSEELCRVKEVTDNLQSQATNTEVLVLHLRWRSRIHIDQSPSISKGIADAEIFLKKSLKVIEC